MLSKSNTQSQNSAMSNKANYASGSFHIYDADLSKFSYISVFSQAELAVQLNTQLNWDQNCIFAEWNELG